MERDNRRMLVSRTRTAAAGKQHWYTPYVQAMLVANMGPWGLLAAKEKAVKDSRDNVDEPGLQEVNNSFS